MRDLLVYRSAGGGSYRRTAWFVWPPAEKRPTGSIRIVGITSGGRVEVDGSTLTGLDGSVTKIDWSGSSPSGQVRRVGAPNGRVVLDVPGSGTSTITATITDRSGTKTTATQQVTTAPRKYVWGRVAHRSSRANGKTYEHVITVPAPVAGERVRHEWVQVGGPTVTLSRTVWEVTPAAVGEDLEMKVTYTLPTAVAEPMETVVWVVRTSFPEHPERPVIESHDLSHMIVQTPPPLEATRFRHDYPADSWTRTLASQHPLAQAGDWTRDGITAPPRADIEADFRSQIENQYRGVTVGTGDYGAALYRVGPDTRREDVLWDNWVPYPNWPNDLYEGRANFANVPVLPSATPAPGTDAQIMFYDPATDTSWDFWTWRRTRTGQPISGSGGRTEGLHANDGQQPSAPVSASKLSMTATHLMLDEVREALRLYDRNDPSKWDHIVGHVLSISLWWPARKSWVSWPALDSDGNTTPATRPWMGQRFSLDPNLDLLKIPNLTPFGHIVTRALQKHGAIITDTAWSVSVGCQSGWPEHLITGVDPWSELMGGQQGWQVLWDVPWTAWRAHKVIRDKADWVATVGLPPTAGAGTTDDAAPPITAATPQTVIGGRRGVTVHPQQMPQPMDYPGTDRDAIRLTRVPGVTWRLSWDNGVTATQVDYPESWFGGSTVKDLPWTKGAPVEVMGVAAAGYVITGASSLSVSFTSATTGIPVTVPERWWPVPSDPAGTSSDAVTVRHIPGITWTVDGRQFASSTFTSAWKRVPVTSGSDVTVTATAETGYALTGTASWTLSFTSSTGTQNGLTPIASWDFNGLTDGPVTAVPSTTGSRTLNTSRGRIVGDTFLLDAGFDGTANVSVGANANRRILEAEFRVLTEVSPYRHTGIWMSGGTGSSQYAEAGVYVDGGQLVFAASSGVMAWGQFNDAGQPRVSIQVGDVLRLRWDTTARLLHVWRNHAYQRAFPTVAMESVSTVNVRQSSWAPTPFHIDSLTVRGDVI